MATHGLGRSAPQIGADARADVVMILIASAFYSAPDKLVGIYIVIRYLYRYKRPSFYGINFVKSVRGCWDFSVTRRQFPDSSFWQFTDSYAVRCQTYAPTAGEMLSILLPPP